MVKKIRKALAGFVLMPSKSAEPAPETPYLAEKVVTRACALRGYSDKSKRAQVFMLPGHEEAEVLHQLRNVVVENDHVPKKASYDEGINLVIFRGVFGSGGYGLVVRDVKLHGERLEIECDFENPGHGIRTTAGFTQPAAIIPLKRLPRGKYQVKLMARELCRSSRGVSEQTPSREQAVCRFKVIA